jgi:ABC-type enterochelin transport system permease subunit
MSIVGLSFIVALVFWSKKMYKMMRLCLGGVAFGLSTLVFQIVKGQNWMFRPIESGFITLLFIFYFAFCLVFWDKKLRGEKFLEW